MKKDEFAKAEYMLSRLIQGDYEGRAIEGVSSVLSCLPARQRGVSKRTTYEIKHYFEPIVGYLSLDDINGACVMAKLKVVSCGFGSPNSWTSLKIDSVSFLAELNYRKSVG